jgi:prepilin-type N-terminal cleavage/methylation domain-containing protein
MKMNLKKGLVLRLSKGFTLIELLVVVAIIGILASVVLASLSSARAKGGDAAVKTNLHTVTSQAELFYLSNNNSYLPASGTAISITTPCPTYVLGGTNMIIGNKNIADAIAEAVNRGGNGSSCYNSSSGYAVAVGLKSSASASWCVDTKGTSKQEAFAPGSAIDTTLFTCK